MIFNSGQDYYNLLFAPRRKIEGFWMKQEENESLGELTNEL